MNCWWPVKISSNLWAMFDLQSMTTPEVKELRIMMFYMHAWAAEADRGQDKKDFFDRWIRKAGLELNKRCNTEKYLPR